jgi:hemolysin activation/secretion protein
MRYRSSTALIAAILVWPSAAQAAGAVDAPGDRQDPSLAREQLQREAPRDLKAPAAPAIPPRQPSAPTLAEPITPGAIRILGLTVVPQSAFAPVIQPYLGRMLSTRDLATLAGEVAGVLRKAGYGLATAVVPPQRIDTGVLRILVDEGRIDLVDAGGDIAVERVLNVLANGRPVRTAMLERQLLLAEDLAGATLDKPQIVRRGGKQVLVVKVFRTRLSGRVGADNWGSDSVGPVRATFNIDLNAPFADNDRLSIGAAVTPAEPGEFQYIEATYARAIGSSGTEAAASGYYAHTRTRADDVVAGGRSFYEGNSSQAELRFTHALVRGRPFSAWATGDMALMDSRLDLGGRPVRSDRIARASALLTVFARGKASWIRGRLGFVQGLDLFGATEPGDPLASRRDASGRFRKLEFYSAYGTDLAPRVGLVLAVQGQFASRPLLVSEEMGLGGQGFLRAFDYRELSGDQGAAASAELRYDLPHLPAPLQRGQLYAYADAGRVSNLRNGFGGGTLASAGGGFRLWLPSGFEANVELGLPLTHSPFHADPAPRFSFTLAKSFSMAVK